jgi:hypothetical protein
MPKMDVLDREFHLWRASMERRLASGAPDEFYRAEHERLASRHAHLAEVAAQSLMPPAPINQ